MVRPTIGNLLLVGAMALVFLVGGKTVFRIFPVRGVSDLFNAA